MNTSVSKFLLLSLFLCRPPVCYADDLPTVSTDPSLCVGYDPEQRTWGIKGHSQGGVIGPNCPSGQAFIGTRVSAGNIRTGEEVAIQGFCCPLPEGSLTEEHSFSSTICPEGSVATGTGPDEAKRENFASPYLLRCTKLQLNRVRLGPPRNGARVATSEEFFKATIQGLFPTLLEENETLTAWDSLPMNLRYGLGRLSLNEWVPEFCVGVPPGSVLVGKTGKECRSRLFREILPAKGRVIGNSEETKPQECLAVDEIFSEHARCLR